MRALFLTAALALISCDQQEAGPVDSEVSPTSGLDDEQTLPGERSLADPTATGPTRAAPQVATVPARFHGEWDYAGGSCDPVSDLHLTIEPRQLVFYESVGTPTRIERTGSGEVTIALDMSGEGETWENTVQFRLADGGDTLLQPGFDGPDEGDLRRKRCDEEPSR